MTLVQALSCDTCAVRHRALCGVLSAEDLRQLNKISYQKKFTAGQTIVAEDDMPDCFATIKSGVIKLTKMLPDGRQQIVGLQFSSDFLGRPFRTEVPFFAEAATDVELCCFPAAEFNRHLKHMPDLEHRLLEITLDELDAAREWMLILGQKTALEKVASFICLLARRAEQFGCGHTTFQEFVELRFELPLTRAEIGEFLGLTIETVSRQMTKLKSQGLIRLDGLRTIILPDPERLSALAEG